MRAEDHPVEIWSHDYSATLKKSKASGKPALVYFSGSNWCPFCKRLNEEIINTEEFKVFAAKNFELVNLDFPRPAPLNDKAYELNVWLMEQHGIGGFPSLLIMDGEGVVLGQLGYTDKGVKEFINQLTHFGNPPNVPKLEEQQANQPNDSKGSELLSSARPTSEAKLDGHQHKTGTVTVDVAPAPKVQAVQMVALSLLNISPGYVFWPKGQAPEPKIITLTVRIDEPVHILSVVSSQPTINASIETLEDGKRYQITLFPLSTDDLIQGNIKITTDYPKGNPKTFYVLAQVK